MISTSAPPVLLVEPWKRTGISQITRTILSASGLSDRFRRRNEWEKTHDQRFLFLTKSFFAEENHCRFENEAHGVEFQSFFDFAEKIGNVQPLHAAVIQQISRTEIDRLKSKTSGLSKIRQRSGKDPAKIRARWLPIWSISDAAWKGGQKSPRTPREFSASRWCAPLLFPCWWEHRPDADALLSWEEWRSLTVAAAADI